MKKFQFLLLSVFAILLMNQATLVAQDFTTTDGGINKILVDTSYVRAIVTTLKPGQKSNVHSHPAHFYYALTDGTLKVFYSDGNTEEYPLKAGDNGFSMPERPHAVQNSGKKTVSFLLVELKEHPYTDKMMK